MRQLQYILHLLLLILLCMGCASDEYVGSENPQQDKALSFASQAGLVTRANGEEAAALLGNRFVVYGTKQTAGSETQVVFPGYEVDYTSNTALSTESNTDGWEYVGQGSKQQTIKYWDYGATGYSFVAYSLGKGDTSASPTTYATAVTSTGSNQPLESLTLTGNANELLTCYFADTKKVVKDDYKNTVRLTFKSLAAKIRLGLYETIPGYSVKEVSFYHSSNDETPADDAMLYASSVSLPSSEGGSYLITYVDGKAQVSYDAQGTAAASLLTIGSLQEGTYVLPQVHEAVGQIYVGRTSNASTITTYMPTLAVNSGTDLHLKVNYTLLSLDGSGQQIHVRGATATVPAAYTHWKSNYAYTYIFKISDNTNGHTGSTSDPAGLYPVTFDAWSVSTDEQQGTITNFAEYSITTYQEESVSGDGQEDSISYRLREPIYITVIKSDGSSKDKVILDGSTDYVRVVLQSSSTKDEGDEEQDYPTGNVQEVTYQDGVATFTPTKGGYYRIEYWHKEDGNDPVKRSVKIAKVGEAEGDGSIQADPDEWDHDYRRTPGRIE